MGIQIVADPKNQVSMKVPDCLRAEEVVKEFGGSASRHIAEAASDLLIALSLKPPANGKLEVESQLELFAERMVKGLQPRRMRAALSAGQKMVIKEYCLAKDVSEFAFYGFAMLRHQERLRAEKRAQP